MQNWKVEKSPPDLPDAPGDRGARCATPGPARPDGESSDSKSETQDLRGAPPRLATGGGGELLLLLIIVWGRHRKLRTFFPFQKGAPGPKKGGPFAGRLLSDGICRTALVG